MISVRCAQCLVASTAFSNVENTTTHVTHFARRSPEFRSDGLKLYPTLVIRGTGLYELWRTGRYVNYTPEQLVELVAQVLALIPPWCRVYRIQRDIPMPLVSSGVEHGNLREVRALRRRWKLWGGSAQSLTIARRISCPRSCRLPA